MNSVVERIVDLIMFSSNLLKEYYKLFDIITYYIKHTLCAYRAYSYYTYKRSYCYLKQILYNTVMGS